MVKLTAELKLACNYLNLALSIFRVLFFFSSLGEGETLQNAQICLNIASASGHSLKIEAIADFLPGIFLPPPPAYSVMTATPFNLQTDGKLHTMHEWYQITIHVASVLKRAIGALGDLGGFSTCEKDKDEDVTLMCHARLPAPGTWHSATQYSLLPSGTKFPPSVSP